MATVRQRKWTSRGGDKTAWLADYKDEFGKRRAQTFFSRKDAEAWLTDKSKEIILARPDERVRQTRLLWQIRRALYTYLGGEKNLTAPQLILVERAAMLQLRCSILDQRIVDDTLTDYDERIYLGYSNSLRRTFAALGIIPVSPQTPPAPALSDYLSQRDNTLPPPPATARERVRLNDD
jgi:hypothetical protein